jgi:hypothetical protein
MRLSDARLRIRETKSIYPNHRSPPWLIECAPPRDRSNRLLDVISRTHNFRTGDDKLGDAGA